MAYSGQGRERPTETVPASSLPFPAKRHACWCMQRLGAGTQAAEDRLGRGCSLPVRRQPPGKSRELARASPGGVCRTDPRSALRAPLSRGGQGRVVATARELGSPAKSSVGAELPGSSCPQRWG